MQKEAGKTERTPKTAKTAEANLAEKEVVKKALGKVVDQVQQVQT